MTAMETENSKKLCHSRGQLGCCDGSRGCGVGLDLNTECCRLTGGCEGGAGWRGRGRWGELFMVSVATAERRAPGWN